jgi:hypothetical protein
MIEALLQTLLLILSMNAALLLVLVLNTVYEHHPYRKSSPYLYAAHLYKQSKYHLAQNVQLSSSTVFSLSTAVYDTE